MRTETDTEVALDRALRPQSLNEYIGQASMKEMLGISIQAAKKRKEALDHCLFLGPPGLGKTTIAGVIAHEMGTRASVLSAPALKSSGEFCAIVTKLKHGDVLFIDEIHRLPRKLEEIVYSAMEDYMLDVVVGSGEDAQTMRFPLSPFTLVGATTRQGMLTAPMRDRFGQTFNLDYYSTAELSAIIRRSASKLKINIDATATSALARRSRGTPRIANRLLRRVRDFVQVRGGMKATITEKLAIAACQVMNIDDLGLDRVDRLFLTTLLRIFRGGPVGINAIAAIVGEDEETLSEVHEPFLMREGFITRGPRGRLATDKARKYMSETLNAAIDNHAQLN